MIGTGPGGRPAPEPAPPPATTAPIVLDDEEIGTVWLERAGPPALLDEMVLDRLAIADDALHLHHSSVARRLDQLGRALGIELTEPDGLLRARLALTAWRPLDG